MIPFMDLPAQTATIRQELEEAMGRVLDSCQYTLGQEVEAFEQEFAAFCGTRHAVGVNSGTSALHVALLAAGAGPGVEVITVPHTFVATVAAICYTGATPVLVDIDPDTLTMDPERVEAAVTSRTRILLPVHLYGQPADMGPLMEIAKRHGLVVIEDAAQAHGASHHGRPVGSLGHMACFSFYPGKNLGACGEGGMVVTDDEGFARLARMYRDWGCERKYHHELLGFNYRMEGIQGAVLRVKLRRLPDWTRARQAHAAAYDRLLGERVRRPGLLPGVEHAYHLYVVRVPGRDRVQQALLEAGVRTGIHYPVPVHVQPAFAHLGHRAGDFPRAEAAAAEVLSLPLYPEMPGEHVSAVAEKLLSVLGDM